MKTNFPNSLGHVLKHEGGFSNHPQDSGGATNKGVVQRVYDSFRRSRNAIPRSVKLIQADEIETIYNELYWAKILGDQLPLGVDYCVFDACVNSGPKQASLWLQRAINKLITSNQKLNPDGNIGPMTIDYADDVPPLALIDEILNQRLGFMKVIRNKKTHELLWKYFGKGWDARLFGEIDPKTGKRKENGVDDIARLMVQLPSVAPIPRGEDAVVVPSPMAKPILRDAPKPVPVKDIQDHSGKVVLAVLAILAALSYKFAVLG